MTVYASVPSPIGELLLVGTTHESGGAQPLAGLYFPDHRRGPTVDPTWRRDDDAFGNVRRQLDAYFAGDLRTFDVDLAPRGSAFQQDVWAALRDVPFGRTASYGELARTVGRPAAARAVGAAVGRNPISIIVPCHRVIGSTGTMTGYAGGLERKQWLLSLEAVDRVDAAPPLG